MATVDPAEYTIEELESELEDIDDPESLEAVLEAERDGQDRVGAKEAIEEELDDATGSAVEERDTRNTRSDGEREADDRSDADGESEPDDERESGTVGLLTIQNRAEEVAEEVIGAPLDGVTGAEQEGDEWRVTVEVVERRSVPDTQDILGRYELRFDGGGDIVGYQRLRRYRRSETTEEF